ncbi:MAG: hypothetical protein OXQ96_02940, partial [Alphaproteobacteria bacterium]|nr:hypothetical protein [Alphaproteobacteria bacterium]
LANSIALIKDTDTLFALLTAYADNTAVPVVCREWRSIAPYLNGSGELGSLGIQAIKIYLKGYKGDDPIILSLKEGNLHDIAMNSLKIKYHQKFVSFARNDMRKHRRYWVTFYILNKDKFNLSIPEGTEPLEEIDSLGLEVMWEIYDAGNAPTAEQIPLTDFVDVDSQATDEKKAPVGEGDDFPVTFDLIKPVDDCSEEVTGEQIAEAKQELEGISETDPVLFDSICKNYFGATGRNGLTAQAENGDLKHYGLAHMRALSQLLAEGKLSDPSKFGMDTVNELSPVLVGGEDNSSGTVSIENEISEVHFGRPFGEGGEADK